MKILVVSNLYYPNLIGGAERSSKLIAEGYAKRGHEVSVLTTSDRDYEEVINGVTIYYRSFKHVFWRYESADQSFTKKILWRLVERNNFLNNSLLEQFLADIKPDVMHTNNIAGMGVDIWGIAKSLGIKVMHTARDYYLLCARSGMFKKGTACEDQCASCKVYTSRYKKESENVDGFIGVSNFVKQIHLDSGYFQSTKINTSINNIFDGDVQDITESNSSDSLSFGVLGAVRETKGVFELIDNINVRNTKKKIKLYIAGECKIEGVKQKLLQKIQDKPIEYLGFVDPVDFFEKIDFLIHPAIWHEPYPRVIIESFSYGIPAIVSSTGGTKEAVINNGTGFVYKNYFELNKIIEELSSPNFDYDSMSRSCLSYSTKFSEKNIIDRYEDVINKIQ